MSRRHKKIVVTGGSGFIGSAVCRYLVRDCGIAVCNVDKLTYAAIPDSLKSIENHPLYTFEKVMCAIEQEWIWYWPHFSRMQ